MLQMNESFLESGKSVSLETTDVADLVCRSIKLVENLNFHIESISDLVVSPVRQQANVVASGERVGSSF